MRFDVVSVPAEMKLSEYLTSGWIENIDPKSVDELTINGFPMATASAKGDQWSFRLYAVQFGSEVYRFIYASKRLTADLDRVFRKSVSTFRRMTVAESQATKPLRLKVVTAGPNDTVERLASRMAISDRRVEQFQIINSLGARPAAEARRPSKDRGRIDRPRTSLPATFAREPAALWAANVKSTPLVSQFRSSHHSAAIPLRTSESKDAPPLIDLVWLWFRSPHAELAARTMRTSEPPH